MRSQTENSIRRQLLYWLLTPLCGLWLITTAIAYYLAVGFANNAYDRELVNSADSVAARLRSDGSTLWVDLPPAAQAILRHSNRDKFYYQVLKQNGTRISGDTVLPGPTPQLDSHQPVFRYAKLNGQDLRIVRIRVDVPHHPEQTVLVQVAETLNSRRQFTHEILLSIVIPQLILIVLGACAVSLGVVRGLNPLKSLERALAQRSQFELTPVSEHDAPAEVRPLVAAINDLLLRLRKELESQQRFVANAAHQFRTPLAGLKTYIGFAKRLSHDQGIKTILDQIDTGTDRMTHLVNKLLTLAKAEPANRSNNFAKLDLNFVASEATAHLVSEALKKNIELGFEASESPAFVYGDPASLTELTVNLVENAVLYTPPGGQVTVRVANGQLVTLSVQDNGPGIPPEERKHVFERFHRVLGTDVPGSGLGLSIVKEIAAAHDASISLESGPTGIGTALTVAFPTRDARKLLDSRF